MLQVQAAIRCCKSEMVAVAELISVVSFALVFVRVVIVARLVAVAVDRLAMVVVCDSFLSLNKDAFYCPPAALYCA